MAGSTVQVQGGDGQSLLTFEVPGTEQHLEAEIVYLGDLLPSLLVTRANDDRRGDYVFAWSAREGRLAEVYREVSRGGYYDPFLAVLVKTMRIGPAYDSGVKWSLPEGKMKRVGGVALLGTGNLRRAITVNHLAALLGWELGAPDNLPAWADEPAWRALVEGLKPYLAGGGLGCFLLEAGSEEQYLLVVVQRGKVILTADATLLQQPDGVRLRSVTGITLRK